MEDGKSKMLLVVILMADAKAEDDSVVPREHYLA